MALVSGLTDGGLLVVAGHIVPLDAVSVEVVQDAQANLLMGGILSGSPVVRLGSGWVGSSGVGPVCTSREGDGGGSPVVPEDCPLAVINNTTCPEVALSVLSYQSVELVLFSWGVQGDGLHAHGVAVLLGLALLELGAAKLPGHDIPPADIVSGVCPEMVGGLGSAECSSSCNPVLLRLRRYGDRLGPEGGSRRGGGRLRLELLDRLLLELLLLLRLETLLRLGLELLLLLGLELLHGLLLEAGLRLEGRGSRLLELLLLKLLWRSPLGGWPRVTTSEKVVECPGYA